MWESSDWLIDHQQHRRVLPSQSRTLGFVLTFANSIFWFVAIILQSIQLGDINWDVTPSVYTLVGIGVGWATVNMIATAGSSYGLFRNKYYAIKSFLTLNAIVIPTSLVIFIFHIIVLNNGNAVDEWLGPSGYCIFVSLYVIGETCIVILYFGREMKGFKEEIQQERLDRIQQRMRQQQEQHLAVLARTSNTTPPSDYDANHVYEAGGSLRSQGSDRWEKDDVSDASSERLTYYPPVFV